MRLCVCKVILGKHRVSVLSQGAKGLYKVRDLRAEAVEVT